MMAWISRRLPGQSLCALLPKPVEQNYLLNYHLLIYLFSNSHRKSISALLCSSFRVAMKPSIDRAASTQPTVSSSSSSSSLSSSRPSQTSSCPCRRTLRSWLVTASWDWLSDKHFLFRGRQKEIRAIHLPPRTTIDWMEQHRVDMMALKYQQEWNRSE